jgi:hypothetical protein
MRERLIFLFVIVEALFILLVCIYFTEHPGHSLGLATDFSAQRITGSGSP